MLNGGVVKVSPQKAPRVAFLRVTLTLALPQGTLFPSEHLSLLVDELDGLHLHGTHSCRQCLSQAFLISLKSEWVLSGLLVVSRLIQTHTPSPSCLRSLMVPWGKSGEMRKEKSSLPPYPAALTSEPPRLPLPQVSVGFKRWKW